KLDTDLRGIYRDSLDRRIAFFESKGLKVFLFGPKPETGYETKYCFARPFKEPARDCQIQESAAHEQQQELLSILKVVLAKHPNVTFF
ncbi:SGNH hydrolase domain-containing protein, partial [Rhizobium brockwellii]